MGLFDLGKWWLIYRECAAQLVSAPLLADAEPDSLVLPNSHRWTLKSQVNQVYQLSTLRLERNPGRMLTEVAEEKKAWKKKRRHLWTFQWMKRWLKVLLVCYGACCIMEILKGISEISNPLCSFIRHHWREAYRSFTQPDKADKRFNNLLLSCWMDLTLTSSFGSSDHSSIGTMVR